MADQDKEEYARLEGVIAALEKQLDVSPQRASPLLSAWLDNCKKQLESMGRKIKVKEQEARVEQELAIQAAVERETALNESEKKEYGGFLREAFFTKADFGRLDSFYQKTWDKLTENGKDEMSHRFWEGIRRNEYAFADAPASLQEKEAGRVHRQLVDGKISSRSIEAIPAKDKEDFIRAFENEDRKEAYRILDRGSFQQAIALGKSEHIAHASVTAGKDAERSSVIIKPPQVVAETDSAKKQSDSLAKAKQEIDGINLESLTLKEDGGEVTASNMPPPCGAGSKIR